MWFRKVFTNGGSEMIKKTDEYWKKDLNQLLVDSLVHPNVADNTKIGFYYYTKAPNYLYKYYCELCKKVTLNALKASETS